MADAGSLIAAFSIGSSVALALAAMRYWFWRRVWFARDPLRRPPIEHGILSPADGTVVYVKRVKPGEDIFVIKQGLPVRLDDIVREDIGSPKLVIGVFMSPMNVHYNRVPLTATLEAIHRHPGYGNVYMGPMHWRIIFGLRPLYQNSVHIVQNERTVTRYRSTYQGLSCPFYIVQIGAKTVNGIDVYVKPGETIERGQKFGMIRIGSQVDLILPDRNGFQVMVQAGDRVRGGETILVR